MDADDRFKHLASDPRFKPLRNKQKKIEIDERFKPMFTDEKFTLKYRKDKRGRKQKKTTGDDLKRYYSIKEEQTNAEPDEESDEKADEKSDEESVEKSDEESDELSNSSSELSSSSDESESEVDETELPEDNIEKIRYDWEPLDQDAEVAEAATKRLAVQNFDWSQLNAKDIFIIVNSVRPPKKVSIYLSEYGKERLKREREEGPPELIDMPVVDELEQEYEDLKKKVDKLNQNNVTKAAASKYEDAEEEIDSEDEDMRERIRRYELNKLKYYYAVVEFDSIESAQLVYKELDGLEYEGSSMELDLRYIPDDMEFEEENLTSTCDKLPDSTVYKAPDFISTALQQTKVKFSWDQTDTRRQDKLRKLYSKQELERDDLEVYLASDSSQEESDDSMPDNDKKMQYQLLLKEFEKDEAKKKEEVDLKVQWDDGDDDEEDKEEEEEDDDDDEDRDESIELGSKKLKKKKRMKSKKNKRAVDDAEDASDNAELELLVSNSNPLTNSDSKFEFDPTDERFAAVYNSQAFNIDPSHPSFKPNKTFEIISKKKRQRREQQQQQK